MTIRRSTPLRNAQAGQRAQIKNVILGKAAITLVDGGTEFDSIVDSTDGLGGFSKGDLITLSGCTTAANDGEYEIMSVAIGTLEIPTASITTAEATVATTILVSSRGGSLSDIMRNCYINIYSGSQLSSADTAATGTLLGTMSIEAGTFTSGTETNGLNFDVAASGVLAKDVLDTWQMDCVAGGVAGYFRVMSNDTLPADGATGIHFDGSVATSGADLNMPTTTLVAGTTYTLDTFLIAFPES